MMVPLCALSHDRADVLLMISPLQYYLVMNPLSLNRIMSL